MAYYYDKPPKLSNLSIARLSTWPETEMVSLAVLSSSMSLY